MISRRRFLHASTASAVATGIAPWVTKAAKARARRCEQNLRAIHEAVVAYQEKRGRLPLTLTSLVNARLIDSRLLICPKLIERGVNTASYPSLIDGRSKDHLTHYTWEYSDDKAVERKERQRKIGAGDLVPIVRCREHPEIGGGHTFLNLALNGAIYPSGILWESQLRNVIPSPYLGINPILYATSLEKLVPLRDRFPKRSPSTTADQIDLGNSFNVALADPWTEGNKGDEATEILELADVDQIWRVGGIRFEIRGLVQLEGDRAADSQDNEKLPDPQFPFEMRPVKVDLETRKLAILCGVIGAQPRGEIAGTLIAEGPDGEIRKDLLHGVHLAYDAKLPEDEPGKIVWQREHEGKALRSVSLVEWDLGAVKKLTRLRFKSSSSACYPLLLAITAAP